MVLRPKKFVTAEMMMVVVATEEFAQQTFITAWPLAVADDSAWTGWPTHGKVDEPDDQSKALRMATDAGYWVKAGESWQTPAPADVFAVVPSYLGVSDPALVSSILLEYKKEVHL